MLLYRACILSSRLPTARATILASRLSAPITSLRPMLYVSSKLLSARLLCTIGVTEVPIPELGAESIVEGGILTIAKSVGDFVAAEEMVAEIETDKVTIEAKSPFSGTITAIHVTEGQTVEVGGKFYSMSVGVGEAGVAAVAPAAAADSARASPAPSAAGRVHASGKPSLIHFPARGGVSVAARAAAPVPPVSAASKMPTPPKPPPAGTVAMEELPLRFRRPPISEEEMEAIMSGGATTTWGR